MIPDSPIKVIAVAIVLIGLILLVVSAFLLFDLTGKFGVTEKKPTAENRVAPRRRVLKSGRIEFNGSGIDCIVRNISETGAAIEVADPIQFPPAFILIIPSDGNVKSCHVVWQRGKRIGVKFSD